MICAINVTFTKSSHAPVGYLFRSHGHLLASLLLVWLYITIHGLPVYATTIHLLFFCCFFWLFFVNFFFILTTRVQAMHMQALCLSGVVHKPQTPTGR